MNIAFYCLFAKKYDQNKKVDDISGELIGLLTVEPVPRCSMFNTK